MTNQSLWKVKFTLLPSFLTDQALLLIKLSYKALLPIKVYKTDKDFLSTKAFFLSFLKNNNVNQVSVLIRFTLYETTEEKQ